jgi:hypothetical protein
MLYRLLPAMLSLAVPWVPRGCIYDGGHGGPGAGGENVGGGAGTGSGSGGTTMEGGSGGAGASGGGAGAGGSDAGASGGDAGSGGTAGAGGSGMQLGSFTLSSSQLYFAKCGHTSAQFTITNTSSVDLTWHPTTAPNPLPDPWGFTFTYTPPGSTLAAGEAVTVTVTVGDVAPASVTHLDVNASIDADVAPPQSLVLSVDTTGRFHTPLPPDIDFGEVVMGNTSAPVFIPIASSLNETETLGSTNGSFSPDNVTARPGPFPGWNVRFRPSIEGPQEGTLIFGTPTHGVDCPPNSFKARGVGVWP